VFAFSYTILIQNLSPHTAQLVERSWLIYSAGRKFADVVGPGVVGKTPILKSGQSFEYSSSAVIDAPVGTMEGRYTFLADDGARFDVEIPRFDLLYPVVIH
jgi:ApaG protein